MTFASFRIQHLPPIPPQLIIKLVRIMRKRIHDPLDLFINRKHDSLPGSDPHDPRQDTLVESPRTFLHEHVRRDLFEATKGRLSFHPGGTLDPSTNDDVEKFYSSASYPSES